MDMETSEYAQLLDLRDHPGFTLNPSETDWLAACKEEPSLFREPVDPPESLFRIHHASLSVRFRSFSDSNAAPEPAEEPIEERPAGPAPAPFPEARPRPPAAARYTPSKMPDAEASLDRQFSGLLEHRNPPSEDSVGSEGSAFTARPVPIRPTPLRMHKRPRSPDPLDALQPAIAAAQADRDADRQKYDLLLAAHCQLQQEFVQLNVQKVPPRKLRRPLPDIEKVDRLNSVSRRPAVADIAHGPIDLPPLMLDAALGTELMAVLNPDCGSADSAWRRGPYQHRDDRSA
jgi:hypothetical protein